jgi:hypothetical protein
MRKRNLRGGEPLRRFCYSDGGEAFAHEFMLNVSATTVRLPVNNQLLANASPLLADQRQPDIANALEFIRADVET